MENLTLEQLSEKLNGNVWKNGDKKRVYLNKGYNTKKMKTTAYVESFNGSFVVRCFIDCPSQPSNWIESQEQQIIESVNESIEEATTTDVFLIKNEKGEYSDSTSSFCEIDNCTEVFYSEEKAEEFISEEFIYSKIKPVVFKMNKDKFEKQIDDSWERLQEERKNKESEKPKEPSKKTNIIAPKTRDKLILKDGIIVLHKKFGEGEVTKLDDKKVEVDFGGEFGKKSLLINYCNLIIKNGNHRYEVVKSTNKIR